MKYTVSLDKAQKLLSKISTLKNDGNNGFFSNTYSINLDKVFTSKEVMDKALKEKSNFLDLLKKQIEVNKCINELKNRIFIRNIEIGLSEKIAKLNELKSELNIYKNLTRNKVAEPIDSFDVSIIDRKIENLKASLNETRDSVQVQFLSNDDIQKRERELKMAISIIEDEVKALNYSTSIELDFDDEVAEYLLLK